jgi:hypothetical protein
MREIRTLRRDVEGAGNVVWSEYMAKSARQSSTLPLRGGRGNPVPYRYSFFSGPR